MIVSANVDIRLITSLLNNPKAARLERRLGQGAMWNLVRLWLVVAEIKPDGCLTGQTAEDIEISADWHGEVGLFTRTLVELRWLDVDGNTFLLHDWREHQPWASNAGVRKQIAEYAALCRFYGKETADSILAKRKDLKKHSRKAMLRASNSIAQPCSEHQTALLADAGSMNEQCPLPILSSPVPVPKSKDSVPDKPAPPKPEPKLDPEAPTTPVWIAYSEAMLKRYGSKPLRDRKMNGLLKELVQRLGDEAPDIAAFYVRSDRKLYIDANHTAELLVRDIQGLRTEYLRSRQIAAQIIGVRTFTPQVRASLIQAENRTRAQFKQPPLTAAEEVEYIRKQEQPSTTRPDQASKVTEITTGLLKRAT